MKTVSTCILSLNYNIICVTFSWSATVSPSPATEANSLIRKKDIMVDAIIGIWMQLAWSKVWGLKSHWFVLNNSGILWASRQQSRFPPAPSGKRGHRPPAACSGSAARTQPPHRCNPPPEPAVTHGDIQLNVTTSMSTCSDTWWHTTKCYSLNINLHWYTLTYN